MSDSTKPTGFAQSGQPSLSQLLSRFLHNQSEAQAAGLTLPDTGDVQPFDAGPVQPIDAKPAWREALAIFTHMSENPSTGTAPPGWPTIVAAQEPHFALAFCVGNFPQLVRNVGPLLQTQDLPALFLTNGTALAVPELSKWANKTVTKKTFPEVFLALGALRLARQFEEADTLISQCEGDVPAEAKALWQNEVAALAWHRGQQETARQMWTEMADSVPVHFNRGMAALFLGDAATAKTELSRAIAQLPETGAWHHLAGLYLSLAENRN